ncbi:MAG TPA: hypothetical protein DDW43_00105 [Nitrosomonas sp.]|nr:hypothetical protein [Nitrosomonas sp. PRO5]HBF23917.1 hypothetical protein [Nitrosomonas sp.]
MLFNDPGPVSKPGTESFWTTIVVWMQRNKKLTESKANDQSIHGANDRLYGLAHKAAKIRERTIG